MTNDPASDLQAAWSPDSRAIVFETNRHNVISGTRVISYNWELYKVDISTMVQTRLTNDPGQDHAAAWSSDGSRIAFISDRDNSTYNFNLFIMNPDGSDQRRVTTAVQELLGPLVWSPDDQFIAAQDGLMAHAEIYVVEVANGAVTRLTYNTGQDANPVWRPDTWK